MKDIVITSSSIKRELFVLLGCFIVSEIVNLVAIIKFGRPMLELLSSIGFVIVFAVVIYLVLWVLRLVILLVKTIFSKK